ncbi:cupin domain-containing protein [uncultured Winogradskyella sp.]|uniref:cupin domain-containing protein n=1 Tax=uncultured Winogradskyella sp. TaxID=395353 RepID=UPI00260F503D|nr:cupin domain-containing protein [uncultured Winogradskyella sp.]
MDKFELFNEYWNPKIIGELNNQTVKLVKVKGELIWHSHANEDELFFVLKRELKICFRETELVLSEGEMVIVEKGVEHKPVAQHETWLLLFEPQDIKHIGENYCDKTLSKFEKI